MENNSIFALPVAPYVRVMYAALHSYVDLRLSYTVIKGLTSPVLAAFLMSSISPLSKKLTTLPFARLYQPSYMFATAFICTSLNW